MRISYLTEKMDTIENKVGNMIWNPNKTEADWNIRISERIGLSKREFFKKIQTAVDRTYKKWDDQKNTCITFLQSKFIMVVNKENNQIITILTSEWRSNSKECKTLIVNESTTDMDEFVNGFCKNNMDFLWGTINLTENLSEVKIDLNCTKCISVRL